MSEPINRDKLLTLINFCRQFITIRDNEINIIDNWCKMNHIRYDVTLANKNTAASNIQITQNDNHSINNVPPRNEDDQNNNIILMTNNVENFLNEIKATIPDDNIIYQNDFTILIHDYIKTNNLYTSDSNTQFIPDYKLRNLFYLKDDVIGIETLNQLIRDVLCKN
jgi:hypothetical protein